MARNLDRRKIKDVENITGQFALAQINALQPIKARHIDADPALPIQTGFISQDFAAVFPDMIRKRKNDDGKGPLKDPQLDRNPGGGKGGGNPGGGGSSGTGGGSQTPAITGRSAPVTELAELFTDDPISEEPVDPIGAPSRPGNLPAEPASGQPANPGAPSTPETPATPVAADEPIDDISNIGGYQITTYDDLIPMLVSAVKELTTQNSGFRDKIAELEKRLAKLQPTI